MSMLSAIRDSTSISFLIHHYPYIWMQPDRTCLRRMLIRLTDLNTPTSSQMSIRPEEIITALSRSSTGKHNPLFSSRQHQDAQELFQLVSECVKREISAVDKESYRDRGLGGISDGRSSRRPIGKSVFDGLTANRRSCKECGYTEAVMHFPFDNWQLALPRMVRPILLLVLL